MVKYKLMFKDSGKRYYNFGPTTAPNGKYNSLNLSQAKKFLREVKKEPDWKGRSWKIRRR